MKLVIATHNAHKLEEFRGLLQLPGLDVAMLPQGARRAGDGHDVRGERKYEGAVLRRIRRGLGVVGRFWARSPVVRR
ncbi:hypothetical protein GCM10025859_09860 [Alicyclobacillus fastidiosus]|nr:hypothetical protein GCM10025859_09860 [Alicyclobacillus fastidiosus]